ncbi:hypothetical protein MXD62_13175 [Frankia sp. Mgl5]|uniref:hypothetical protein n=1 Tax=Frankia sp. Mgl5 TaxID=2933793 RepID=UPI00200CFFBB|nr:hypothetical protein [Frankia sp. Mgl5]MCK9928113.1 hypothetical protein [Frankia sp. Mgl5]
MSESYLMLDLDDMLRRAEAGDIDGTDVSALVADVRRKHRLLVEAETARHTAEKQVFDVSGELSTARRVIDAAQSMLGAALMPGHPEGGPLLGEGIRQLVAELETVRADRASAYAAALDADQTLGAARRALADAEAQRAEAHDDRDRARDIAVALEQENAILRQGLERIRDRADVTPEEAQANEHAGIPCAFCSAAGIAQYVLDMTDPAAGQ